MAKNKKFNSKRKSNTKKETVLPDKPIKVSQTPKILSIIWKYSKKIVPTILALFSFVQFYYLFYPQVSIEVGQSSDYRYPYNTNFLICNNGYFSFYDLGYSIHTEKIKSNSQDIILSGIETVPYQEKVGELKSNKKQTIRLNGITKGINIPMDVDTGQVFIKVNFYTRFLFIKEYHSDSARFVSERTSQGYLWNEKYTND
jgi:hypothetical protein